MFWAVRLLCHGVADTKQSLENITIIAGRRPSELNYTCRTRADWTPRGRRTSRRWPAVRAVSIFARSGRSKPGTRGPAHSSKANLWDSSHCSYSDIPPKSLPTALRQARFHSQRERIITV